MLNARKTILVVEDERVVAKDLQRNLIELGYHVPSTASSAEEALRIVADRCPDLVLMDVRIEGERDGIDTAELLRSRFGVPVVYITAYADERTVARAKKTEPYGYLLKPVRPEELSSTVEIALHKHELERRRVERERRLATTLRSIGDAVLSTDAEGRIAFMNPVAETLTGWLGADAVGRPLCEVLQLRDERTQLPIADPIAQAIRDGRPLRVEGLLITKHSEGRAIADSAAPIVDEFGNVMGGVLVFRDMDEQRRMQRQLQLGNEFSAVSKSAAGLAHEINNPLTFVMANIQFALAELRAHEPELAGEPWVEEIDRALADAQGGADRVRRIVNDPTPHIRSGGAGNERAELGRVVDWSLKLAQHELQGKARVVTELGRTPAVAGDETRLGQVLLNLLVNAAHALPDGRAENEIRITTALTPDGRVLLEVRDNGAGMAADVLQKIFEPFFTTKARGRGTGLGLSICRGIVASVGGEISVTSTQGRGSSFRVLLHAAASGVNTDGRDNAGAEREPGSILIVDDEPMVNESLRRILMPLHRVTMADDGGAALQLIANGSRFDLVICDLMMDGMSGMELHAELAKSDPDQARRMLFMTGGAFTTRSIEFLKTIANPCMQKPLRPAELETTVERLLNGLGRAEIRKAS